jgi:exodeoxyribonuclease-3
MKLFSWNVNGIRAVINKGEFNKFIKKYNPDILCLQETKIDATQLSKWREIKATSRRGALSQQGVAKAPSRSEKSPMADELISQPESLSTVNLLAQQDQAEIDLPEYYEYWNSANKKGYSGTAIFSKTKAQNISYGLPEKIINQYKVTGDTYGNPNNEGRVITAEYDSFYVVTVYTPNSKGDLSRLNLRYKHWDPAFLAYVKSLEKSKPVLFCGDLNVAHTEDDLANPKANVGKHGFTNEERKGFQNIIEAGFVDTFRIFTPTGKGYYTWWTHWANARARNVGWRIDYWLASTKIAPKIKNAQIHSEVMGSDHCPVSIELDV